jgi:hypothetical protein
MREIWVIVRSLWKLVMLRQLTVALGFSLVSCSFGNAFTQPPASIDRQTLTTLRQVRNFEPHPSGGPVSVHVRGVVTYYDCPSAPWSAPGSIRYRGNGIYALHCKPSMESSRTGAHAEGGAAQF